MEGCFFHDATTILPLFNSSLQNDTSVEFIPVNRGVHILFLEAPSLVSCSAWPWRYFERPIWWTHACLHRSSQSRGWSASAWWTWIFRTLRSLKWRRKTNECKTRKKNVTARSENEKRGQLSLTHGHDSFFFKAGLRRGKKGLQCYGTNC